ncbi:beta-glucosidase [Bifidobacterium miconisargentati]|uniref:beta-glucosidase n=1 Tax=Bifidobacterium miconisargentati TaxID=2834437 RepID=UPI001F3558BC|nr:glycoside hydrolase family 3 C-terminal domain-containing protein [Bifidobacterium miconisargentati]
MMKGQSRLLWRGLTSVAATLLVFGVCGTQTALTYTGTINSALGTSTTKIVNNGDAGDTDYYKSSYGDLNAENLQKLIADTYDEAVQEQEEGSVLLRNENNALPMKAGSVTLFGHAVVQPVYDPGGANSTAAEHEEYTIDLKEALETAGFKVNDTLYQAYKKSKTTRVASNNLQVAGGPTSTGEPSDPPELGEEPSSFYTNDLQSSWQNDYNDAAIVMLAREGGEDTEMMMEDPEGISSLSLHQDEKDLLQMIKDSGKFSKIIVLLNSAYPMEVEWLDDYDVDACLWIGNPGQRGFEGVTNLLTGKANPSGRLTDTYAVSSMSSPAAHVSSQNTVHWANNDEVTSQVSDKAINVQNVVVQSESIYVGYKYYETRYEDTIIDPSSGASSGVGATNDASSWKYENEVSYPFGYGLSYTTFDQELTGVTYDEDKDLFTAEVKVTNTGDVAGQSVVELYAQTPYGDYERKNLVEKSAIQLAGQGKTKELAPGASETVKITVDRYLLASYDYTKARGYILSAGDYYFAIGDNAHDALNNVLAAKGATGMTDIDGNAVDGDAAKTYHWSYDKIDTDTYKYSDTGEEVTNQFEDADANYWQKDAVTYLTRSDWKGTFPTEPVQMTATDEMIELLKGDLYKKADDAKSVSDYTQGADNGLTFVMMKDVDYNDDDTWNKYLDQMTVEEMTSQLSDMFGTPEVASVGRPAYTSGDGTASIGDNTYAKEYGDTRNVTLYPSTGVEAATWSYERMQRRGELQAEEAMYCNMPLFWGGGGNLHRTPFGGRNGEYWSEDSIITYLDNLVELSVIQDKGIAVGVKHVTGNDQELYREGLNLFFNEQAFREGSLKAEEGILSSGKSTALMQAFNRIGLVFSSSSKALVTQVIRNEWGFKGMEETDGIAGGEYKSHFTSSLSAGTTTYCIDPEGTAKAAILQWIENEDDGDMLGYLRSAVKNFHYTLSHTILVNGLSTNSTVVKITPWWQYALYGIDGVFGLLTAGAAVMLVLSSRHSRKDATVTVQTTSGK